MSWPCAFTVQESAAHNAVTALYSAYGVRYRYGPASTTLCEYCSVSSMYRAGLENATEWMIRHVVPVVLCSPSNLMWGFFHLAMRKMDPYSCDEVGRSANLVLHSVYCM